MSMRRLVFASLLLAGFAISACTAFYVPDRDVDNVQRCNNGEDCDPIDDNRYIAVCVTGEGQPENSDKVCASDFAEINCNPEAYPADDPIVEYYDELTSNQIKGIYGQCEADLAGMTGCQSSGGSCDEGEPNDNNICSGTDPNNPAVNPSEVGGVEIAGQDALDQFCRSYFCDETFVCDTSGSKWTCKPCNRDAEFGSGGCGTLYIDGAPATVYTDAIDSSTANCDGDMPTDAVVFGPLPDPPTP
jgi:hypothetical protein